MTNDNLGAKLMNSFSAKVWAEEFKKMNPDCDEELMLAWFASAIMCGHDFAWRKQQERIEKLESLKALADNIASNITGYRTDGLTLLGSAEKYEEESRKLE